MNATIQVSETPANLPTDSVWAHTTALVDRGARIGAGTRIWHFTHVCGRDVHIGANSSFGQNCYVGNSVQIGQGVRVQNNVSIYDGITMEDYVFCGPSVVFTNVINPRAHIPRKNELKQTIIRKGASLGANCTVVCGIEIGAYAMIAAGAVVHRSVPAFALMAGVPALQKGWVCHCGHTLARETATPMTRSQLTCSSCQSSYDVGDGRCLPIQLRQPEGSLL